MNTRRLLLAITAVATVTATSLLIGPRSPAIGKGNPGGGGDAGITNPAYLFSESGTLYLTTIDGSQTLKLTNPKARTKDCCANWSPDLDPDTPGYQGKIAYLHRYEPGMIFADLFVMNPDGSGRRLVKRFSESPIPYETFGASLAWTRNGKEIVFSSQGDRLYAVEIATGNVRILLERIIEYRQIHWPRISPLGVLSFLTDGDIYIIDTWIDADGLIQVDPQTATPVVSGERFAWSPDGTRLAYTIGLTNEFGEDFVRLEVYDLVYDDFTLLLEVPEWRPMPITRPTWSPDGSQIAYQAWVTLSNGKESTDIVRITNWADPDTREFINVTGTNGAYEAAPMWSPGWTAP